jgi:hypothetical protein
LEVRPGVFGLKVYPPREEQVWPEVEPVEVAPPVPKEAAPKEAPREATDDGEPKGKKGRRRGGRGKGKKEKGAKAASPEQPKREPQEKPERHERHERRDETPLEAKPAPKVEPAPPPVVSAPPQPQAQPRPPRPSLLGPALEVLRSFDGRPMHVRHLMDEMAKRGLVGNKSGDRVRELRTVLWKEQRQREQDGLRPRVRATGGGYFALEEKRLDAETARAENELEQKLNELRNATKLALKRRLGRLSHSEFESFCRVLIGRMGIAQLEFVRRGDGVLYFLGERAHGAVSERLLIALKPTEAEISRRSVGELRAGLPATGCQLGWLLSPGRLSDDGVAELRAGLAVEVFDGDGLAQECLRHGVGTRRSSVPVDLLDLDFLGDLE